MDLKTLDPSTLDAINGGYLFLFVFLVIIALLRIGARYISYRKEKKEVPLLLKRDLFFLSGLALPFMGVLFFRAFKIDAREMWWYIIWILISGSFAIAALIYWVWIEYFKIDK